MIDLITTIATGIFSIIGLLVITFIVAFVCSMWLSGSLIYLLEGKPKMCFISFVLPPVGIAKSTISIKRENNERVN